MHVMRAAWSSRPKVLLCLASALLVSTPLAAEIWQKPAPTVAPDAALGTRVRSIVAGMTLGAVKG